MGVGGEGSWPRITFFFHKADLMQKDLGCQERFPLLSPPPHTHAPSHLRYSLFVSIHQPLKGGLCVLILEARLLLCPSLPKEDLGHKKPFSSVHVSMTPSALPLTHTPLGILAKFL